MSDNPIDLLKAKEPAGIKVDYQTVEIHHPDGRIERVDMVRGVNHVLADGTVVEQDINDHMMWNQE